MKILNMKILFYLNTFAVGISSYLIHEHILWVLPGVANFVAIIVTTSYWSKEVGD